MATETMGRVTTEARIENMEDLWAADRGLIQRDQVRSIIVPDALVDTGATTLSLPSRLIRQLGLTLSHTKRAISSEGACEVNVYRLARLTIMGRDCPVEVLELPDEVPPLIGQLPLEALDLVVDMPNRRLIGNPAHGGEHIIELF
jgi:clan AA aspartic protease